MMRIDSIKVGDRVRTELGWLDSLERSIEYRGLLQPIGVTPDGTLIFGARRLEACKNLGWKEIPVRVIDVDADDPAAALKMERDENEVRKDFTPSEKVAIAQKIEEAMGNRQGHRTELQQTFAEVAGKQTRDVAAAAVGWSGEQYRQAKHVMASADEKTKQAVDSGELSVNKAHRALNGGGKPQVVTVRLAYEVEPDARSIIVKSGGEYATRLALKILELEGHEVISHAE